MVYRMNVAGLERDLPICRVTDDLYIAGFVTNNLFCFILWKYL